MRHPELSAPLWTSVDDAFFQEAPMSSPEALTAHRLALRLGVKTGTLAAWRRRGRGPQGWFYLSPILVAYPLDEVERWEEGRRKARPKFGRPPTAPPGGWPKHAAGNDGAE
jgi:hypothetical protein